MGIDRSVLVSYTKSCKMSVDTYCLDFHVVPCHEEAVYIRDVATVATCVAELLRQDCLEQGCIFSAYSYTAIYSGPKDSVFTIKHYFREGLVTLTIECFRVSIEDALFRSYDEVEILQKHIRRNLDAESGACIPAIRRCLSKSPYMRSSDDRIQQFRWEALLFSQQSPHQLVEIFRTVDYGNVLVLDGFVNIAESDLIYTQSLMCQGKQQYKDKEILILGGGDGALLHELLKETPKFVTMVDIDEAVIKGCSQHMKSICGDVLDKGEGDNYKVIVDDAFKWLKQYDEEGKQFDFIFGDLTDIPVHNEGSTWEFVRSILKLSLSLLPVGGKYMTHCNGKNSAEALDVFENEVKKIGYPLEIVRSEAYVPSFLETWVFFQLTRKEGVVNGIAGKEANGGQDVPMENGDVKKEQKGTPDKEVKEVKNEKPEVAKEAEKDAKGRVTPEKDAKGRVTPEKDPKGRVTPEKDTKVNGDKKEAKTTAEKKETAAEKKGGVKNTKEKLESPKTESPKPTDKGKTEKNGKKKDAK